MTAGSWCFLLILGLAHRGSAFFLDSHCSSRNPKSFVSTEKPWMALIASPTRNCSGVLIKNQYVMTSASCVFDQRDSVVWLGKFLNLTDNQRRRDVKHFVQGVYTHKLYNKHTLEHDIALLILDGPVTYQKSILPICIWLGEIANLNNLKAHRWGLSKQLIFQRRNSVEILNVEKCRDSFGVTIQKSQICAGFKGSKNCTEPGSPLVKEISFSKRKWNILIGIQSDGVLHTCIYNNISNYIDWIVGIVLSVDVILSNSSEIGTL
ncbi:vitamin K-dependent protein C [Drosophila erecta]|uniref:vitamin K-dependent protein C n=1 Tax=Drosophila erecta TaxID=7220 RepID=UPI0007327E16|nr:vitamin K-dependent protein C [Drosophila erecta]KQS52146.1 uncharacterized protein Dere_GG26778 [Drosophila erecta]